MPHPAPNAPGYDGEENQSKMGSVLSVFKTIFIPAVISLVLYLLISYIVVPLWKRYRGRYSQYLPMDTISTHTSSVRERVHRALLKAVAKWLLPSSWRTEFEREQAAHARTEASDFDEDEGEELYTVGDVESNRREAISLDVQRGRDDAGRRLSRELEEGFKDDSDESEDEAEIHGSRSQGILR